MSDTEQNRFDEADIRRLKRIAEKQSKANLGSKTLEECLKVPTSMARTYCQTSEVVLPNHANSYNITFGGIIMQWMEMISYTTAARHTRTKLVTGSVDSLQFRLPTHIGDLVHLQAIVSTVGKSSIEIYVTVTSWNEKGNNFTNDAFFTFVAVDKNNYPITIDNPISAGGEAQLSLQSGSVKRRATRISGLKHIRSNFIDIMKNE